MNIRRALQDDVTVIRYIARQAYIKYVPRIGREPAPMVADFQAYVQDGVVYVAELNDAIAGYVIAFSRDGDYFIENIAVDPMSAGNGVGRAMMVFAENQARAGGKGKMVLYTNVRMHENFPFYEALGYRTTGMIVEAGFRRVYFEKDLSSDEG